MEQLDEQRSNIDKIDDEIAALFRSRMEVCRNISLIKRSSGVPVLNTDRERQVLDRVLKSMPDELKPFAKQLFSTLFEMSKVYQGNLLEECLLIQKKSVETRQRRKQE